MAIDWEEYIQVALMPSTHDFVEFLEMHAGKDAPLGQFGFFPGAHGETMTAEMAAAHPECARWIGMPVFDGPGLVESFVRQTIPGSMENRLEVCYVRWCEGHLGPENEESVYLPGGAVFRQENGRFVRVGYLTRATGSGKKDWLVAVCDDPEKGLMLEPMGEGWTHWGLINMVMRYNVHTKETVPPPALRAGEPYAVVYSSVLNCRSPLDNHIMTCIPNGSVVRLTGKIRPDWTQVELGDGKIVWVFSKFIIRHE